MATTLPSDMKVYDPKIQAGFTEQLIQNTEAFNSASNNTIRLVTNREPGDYDYEAFFQNISDLVTRRDETSVSAATSQKLTQEEDIGVKLNRKIGPVDATLASFRKAGLNDGALRFVAGQQAAKAVTVEMLNTGLAAEVAALNTQSALKTTVATNGTLDTPNLVTGLSKVGDASDNIAIWVMHSKVYFDLIKDQIADNIDGVSSFNIFQGRPGTLNRPVLVTDSPSLLATGGSGTGAYTNYFTLGLTRDALLLEDSEEETIAMDIITGLENLVMRMQGEYAYSLRLKGFKYDVANGGKNPNAAAIGTGTNWDKNRASIKDLGGVIIQSR